MKTTTAIFLFLLSVAQAVPEFVGVMSTKEEGTKYAVRPTPNDVSRWVKQGDVFAGYVVSDYRAKDEVLVLKKDGQTFQLRMKDAKVVSGESQRKKRTDSSKSVAITGALRTPTNIEAGKTMTLADAIAAAGGFADGANPSAVRVTRPKPDGSILLHSVDASPNATGAMSAASFTLQAGDAVFVPKKEVGKK
jgi:hypothetical protein